MRKTISILAVIVLAVTTFLPERTSAQTPERMSYQAVIRDANSQLKTNQDMGMQISILQGSANGTAVYVETQSPTSNVNGLINIEIGTGTTISGNFSSIDWANNTYFIKTETDPTTAGGTTYTITNTSQLLSVPYALHAKTAESISGSVSYSVGDFAHGGIIFWLDESGQHGLVCAKEDQSTGIQWHNGTGVNTEAHGDGAFSGIMNTVLIVAVQGSNSNNYAAGLSANLSVTEGGKTYGDWYLPSKEELDLMYQNKSTIDATAIANGGDAFTSTDGYWSSTEDGDNYAWRQYFDNGAQFNYNKSFGYRVRSIRTF